MLINEVTQPVTEGVHDPHIFKAVFMAGSPGSGKTTVAKKLFDGTGMKFLNVDDFYNYLRQIEKTVGDPEVDYETAWEKYRKREKNYLDGRLGLIIDGTGKNPNIMKDLKDRLEEMGYETAMVFVNTTLETSIDRAKKRAETPGKDFGRKIDLGFIELTWNRVQQALGKLQEIFQGRFYIIDNDRPDINVEYVERKMRKWLATPPKSHIAKQWINQQGKK